MGIQGIGANSYPMGYGAARTEKNKPEEANKSWTVKSESQGLILHGQETQEDGKVVTAWACATDNTSMTVYQPQDFDPANPVYKVKIWDSNGNVTERMVDISAVDPSNCDTIEMYAYSAYLSDSGKCPDALQKFMMAHAHHKDRGEHGQDSLFCKENWLEIIKEVMEMQYKAGNLKGYMEYKKFLYTLEAEKEGKEKKAESKQEESKVETDIEVKPDGSRILVMTRTIGGMAATTSIELSKPTSTPNSSLGKEELEEMMEKIEKKEWTVPDISAVSEQLFGEEG
ncbi:hypothetical protein D3Z45_13920 [Lachnospiraceae bacterium]|nr:hypothetical protein [Lachnospiraceae bacterium]